MSSSNLVVTVTAPYKKAVFTWDESCESCSVSGYGFDDQELQMLVASKAHEGASLEGFEVSIQ